MDVKQATDILRILIKGWPPDLDEETLAQWVRAVEEKHGDGEVLIGSETYPRAGPIVKSGPEETDWHYTSGERWQEGERWVPIGMRYYVRFKKTGQELAVIVNHAGEIIGREYADDGRPHHYDNVAIVLRGWPKVEPQAYRGGRKAKDDLTMDQAEAIMNEWTTAVEYYEAHPEDGSIGIDEFIADYPDAAELPGGALTRDLFERAQRMVRRKNSS